MQRRSVFGIASVAAASLLVACGSSGGGSSDASASGGSTGGPLSADRSMKIGVLFEIKGEGSAGISDYANAAELAINQINARGGVGGKPIETKRLAVNGLDPQKAGSDFLQMVDWKPDLIVGFPSSTIEAVVPQITRAQIPVLTPVQEEEIGHGGRFGSDYLWMVPPVGSSLPVQAVDFLTKDPARRASRSLARTRASAKAARRTPRPS